MEVYCKLLTFVVPKMQSIEFKEEEKKDDKDMTPEETKEFVLKTLKELKKHDNDE